MHNSVFLAHRLLPLYWNDERLQLSAKIAANNSRYCNCADYVGQLIALQSLLARSYSLPTDPANSFFALAPYSLCRDADHNGTPQSYKSIILQYPSFYDLYFRYSFSKTSDQSILFRWAQLSHLFGRFDLAFSALCRIDSAVVKYYSYLSGILPRLNSYYSPQLPLLATQAAWQWSKTSVAYSIISSLFLRPISERAVSDHASRIFMYLSLPHRAIRSFQALLSLHGQTLSSIPHTLLSTAVYLYVSDQYQNEQLRLPELVAAIRGVRPCRRTEHHQASPSMRSDKYESIASISEKLNITVLSPDFRYHPVGRFWMPLHQHLSRRANISIVSLNPECDGYTEEVRASSASFDFVAPVSIDDVQDSIQKSTPDVIIDLAGHTADNCFPVLNVRNADLQVTYLGFFGPTYASEVDYWIVDKYLEPYLWAEPSLAESRWQLPFCHLFYDRNAHRVPLLDVHSRRRYDNASQLRIGSFNHTRKLSDKFLSFLASLFLQEYSNYPLLIFKSHSFVDLEMRRWFMARLRKFSIPLSSVLILPFAKSDTLHFSDYCRVDIHVDSFPICGTTTTFDSLSMRTPVATVPNGLYAGSVTAGILSAFGMSDFIAPPDSTGFSLREFRNLASMAQDPSFWEAYDLRQREHLTASPRLFEQELTDMLRSKRS